MFFVQCLRLGIYEGAGAVFSLSKVTMEIFACLREVAYERFEVGSQVINPYRYVICGDMSVCVLRRRLLCPIFEGVVNCACILRAGGKDVFRVRQIARAYVIMVVIVQAQVSDLITQVRPRVVGCFQ